MVEAVLTWILIQEALHERAAWVRSKEKVGNAGKAEAKDIKVFPQSSRGGEGVTSRSASRVARSLRQSANHPRISITSSSKALCGELKIGALLKLFAM